MKKRQIRLSDFAFTPWGYRHYKVKYTSPVTLKEWTKIIPNMPLIDATKNADEPKRKDLEELRRFVKC